MNQKAANVHGARFYEASSHPPGALCWCESHLLFTPITYEVTAKVHARKSERLRRSLSHTHRPERASMPRSVSDALASPFGGATLRPPSPSALKNTSRWYIYVIEVLQHDVEGVEGVEEWKIAYCGCTNREALTRMEEHKHQSSGAVRVVASIGAFGLNVHRMRVMAAIDVPDEDSKASFALETYLMRKHDTIVPKYNKLKDLFAHENRIKDFPMPDIQLPGRSRNFQLNCKRSTTDGEAIEKAARFFEEACSRTTICVYKKGEQEELLDDLDKFFGLEEPLPRFIAPYVEDDDANTRRVEFVIDDSFMQARELRLKYQDINGWEEVDPDEIVVDLSSVADFQEGDTLITSQVKRVKLSVHSDHRKNSHPTAEEAASVFRQLELFTGSVMEEQLSWLIQSEEDSEKKVELTKETAKTRYDLLRARKWRDWVRMHGGTLPKPRPDTDAGTMESQKEEKTIGKEIETWKSMRSMSKGAKQRNRNLYLLVMRDFDSFADSMVPQSQRTADVDKKTNKWLREGFGMECERLEYVSASGQVFPALDLKPLPARGRDGKITKVYNAWGTYLRGERASTSDDLLAGLPPDRVAKAQAIHADREDGRREEKRIANRKLVDALHSAGVVTKKQGKRPLENPHEEDVESMEM